FPLTSILSLSSSSTSPAPTYIYTISLHDALPICGAQAIRLARHLFNMATTASPGKEVRVIGIGDRLATQRRAAWERWYELVAPADRKSTRLNSSHQIISYAVFCLKKKKEQLRIQR